jgi:hypothetical protein
MKFTRAHVYPRIVATPGVHAPLITGAPPVMVMHGGSDPIRFHAHQFSQGNTIQQSSSALLISVPA